MRGEAVSGELFLHDAYLREFDARVVRTSGREVWLEHTAFYPGGGGQPHDKGTLKVGPVEARVVDVQRREGEIVHVTDNPIPRTIEHLVGELDWGRRYAHMRHHTALHALSALLWRDHGAKVTGGRMYADRARMDFSFSGEWSAGVVEEIQPPATRDLAAEGPVKVYDLAPEEAAGREDLIRTRESLVPEELQAVRVVEIEGLDAQADGGTHVANTREAGRLEITSHKSKGRDNKRVEFVLR